MCAYPFSFSFQSQSPSPPSHHPIPTPHLHPHPSSPLIPIPTERHSHPNLHLPVFPCITLCPPASLCVSLCLRVSPCISMYLPVPPYISRRLPLQELECPRCTCRGSDPIASRWITLFPSHIPTSCLQITPLGPVHPPTVHQSLPRPLQLCPDATLHPCPWHPDVWLGLRWIRIDRICIGICIGTARCLSERG